MSAVPLHCQDVQAEYRRQSRRLRATLGHDPVRLYRQLKQLGDETTAAPTPSLQSEKAAQVAPSPGSGAAAFAAHVAQRLTGTVLPYSDRVALLRDAGQRGIARFEANLIIAAVQHRGEAVAASTAGRAKRRSVGAVLMALLLQCAIVAGCWWMATR